MWYKMLLALSLHCSSSACNSHENGDSASANALTATHGAYTADTHKLHTRVVLESACTHIAGNNRHYTSLREGEPVTQST